jgi:hypothetical protein
MSLNRKNMIPFYKINEFLRNGTLVRSPSNVDLHILSGWQVSTLKSYNSAVIKYLKFPVTAGRHTFVLPISPEDIENFCLWAGRSLFSQDSSKISVCSIKKYLAGLRAWHVFHKEKFPDINKARIDLMLKASAKEDELVGKQAKKLPMMLWHMTHLWKELSHGSDFDKAVLDMAVVAFWGLARLSELSYDSELGTVNFASSVLTSDVVFDTENIGVASIAIRNAKTGAPGKPQLITLREQEHVLCPILALKRRLSLSLGTTTTLFGYMENGVRHHLTRRRAVARVEQVLAEGGYAGLHGHSFRVGGASFRLALGMTTQDLCFLGRWKSDCYKLYIRPYDPDTKKKTLMLLSTLKSNWKRMGL